MVVMSALTLSASFDYPLLLLKGLPTGREVQPAGRIYSILARVRRVVADAWGKGQWGRGHHGCHGHNGRRRRTRGNKISGTARKE